MSTSQRAARLETRTDELDLSQALDERTAEILEHRRKTAVVRRRGWLVRRMLLAADLVGLGLAFLTTELVFGDPASENLLSLRAEAALFVAMLPAWVLGAKLFGLYDRDEERTDHSTADELARVFLLVTVAIFLLMELALVAPLGDPDLTKLTVLWVLAVVLVTSARVTARGIARKSIAYVQNTVIVGAGDVGQLVARKLLHHPEYGVNLLGFVDAAPKERRDDVEHLTLLGPPERLPDIVRAFDVERVVVAFSNEDHEQIIALIRSLQGSGVQIDIVPRLFEIVGPTATVHTVEALPLVGLPPAKISRSSRLIKRSIDIVGALIGLVLTAPLFAIAAWRIKRDSPGPVFFRQARLGMDMQEFTPLKFRTMRVETDDAPHREYIKATMSAKALPRASGLYKLERGDSVTPSGRWLRGTSLDELPQLINVLRGEMSLVGPRPCLPYETENFAPHHFDRFLVPAGLTGLWQVSARAHSTFGEALDMDVAYARSWSLGLDVQLLCRTPLQVLRSRGTA